MDMSNTTTILNYTKDDCPLPELCDDQGGDNVGLAFGLTIAAGLATLLGSFLPFIPCVKRTSKQWLACSLALAAGVMLYVSFTEILTKSNQYFCCEIPEHYDLVAVASFFGGILLTIVLDLLTKFLIKLDCGFLYCCNSSWYKNSSTNKGTVDVTESNCPSCVLPETNSTSSTISKDKSDVMISDELPSITNFACEELRNTPGDNTENSEPKMVRRASYAEMLDKLEKGSIKENTADNKQEHSTNSLRKMGLLTCLAIGIHNFPEGIATFVATLSSPSLGAALAIAIAMHNVPEGVCVAMPVYFATGSKLKALWWSFLSGISEPIGALLGWLIFKELFGSVVYGVLFGLVAGMMVYISLMELLPTAYKYSQDKTRHLVPVSLIIGMAIMASSLLLFLY